jgi:hypothetical protein
MNKTPLILVGTNRVSITLCRWIEYPDGWYGYVKSPAYKGSTASFYSKKEWNEL